MSRRSTPADAAAPDGLARLRAAVAAVDTRPVKGRVTNAVGTLVRAVMPQARIGEICSIEDAGTGFALKAEVVGIAGRETLLAPIGDLHGLAPDADVRPLGKVAEVPVGERVLGRVLDAHGIPMDGLGSLGPGPCRALHAAPPAPLSRGLVARAATTGLRVLDGLLTTGVGQRVGIYGEPGCGKSALVSQVVAGAEADAVVVALVGERGREVREFVQRSLTEAVRARSTVVVATSDRPAPERIACAQAATAIAEHFRDEGRHVLLLVDNITRFARALREVGLAAGEPPTRRGFPPSVMQRLPQLLERAGPGERGAITAFYAVLVEGDGEGDPIAEETRGILDGHVVLSRRLAASGDFPAIDVLASRSRVMDAVVPAAQVAQASRFRTLLSRHADVEFLQQVGEYKPGGDADADEALLKIAHLRAFLRQPRGERSSMVETREWMGRLLG